MHPLALHLTILVAAGAIGVLGHLAAAAAGTTPALRFWEEALPGTPVPDVIADLVQKGIDHSPLVEHYPVTKNGVADGSKINYAYASCRRGCQDKAKQLPAGFYFQQAQVRVGSTMTVYLPAAAPPNPILPRDVASRVPFSNLPDVLAKFNIAPSSADAAVVAADTLSLCEASPPAGEQKACATSLEAIVGGATRMLAGGGRGAVYWAASSALPRAGLPLRQYAVQAVTPLAGDRHVGCHGLPYPYAVYYCHMTGRPTKAYAVTLAGDGGSPPVTMAALCHLDTSNWDPTHPAFEMLHTRPGAAPVCHFMSYANLLFGAN